MEKQLLIFSAGALVGAGAVVYGGLRFLAIPSVTKFLGAAAGDKFADWVLDEPMRTRQPRRVQYHDYNTPRTTAPEAG